MQKLIFADFAKFSEFRDCSAKNLESYLILQTNEENEFDLDQFKPKYTFNPRNKDATIEVYMSNLEEKLMKIEIPKDKYDSLTSKERQALYDLKNDKNIVIKSADKESAIMVWDREDYIKGAEKQLGIVMSTKKSLMILNHLLAPFIER